MKKIYLSLLATVFPSDVVATSTVICDNPGLCTAHICVDDIASAQGECQKSCGSLAKVVAVTPDSNCVIGGNGAATYPPVPWQDKVRVCGVGLDNKDGLAKSEQPAEVEPRTRRTVCLPVPQGMMTTELFCEATDAYGAGWCTQGLGDQTRCDIGWAWAESLSSRVFSDGSQEICVKFYNQSDNRNRSFYIYGKIVPQNDGFLAVEKRLKELDVERNRAGLPSR